MRLDSISFFCRISESFVVSYFATRQFMDADEKHGYLCQPLLSDWSELAL